ncbi:MAG: Tat pathway signal protein, partial [Caulobacterales bacterium]|nr:Tat pathway signal protein [Caulobacterales bacterium]
GGQILGDIPVADFDHNLDSGAGRLIPNTSVEQYAAELGRWFGLTDTELNDALPAWSNFDANRLNGLFV